MSEATEERNKRTVERFYNEVLNGGDVELIDELVMPNHVSWDTTDPEGHGERGSHNLKNWVTERRRAFPDLQVTVEDWIAENDRVVSRWTAKGTHTGGDFQGIPASGSSIEISGIAIDRFDGDRTAESWLMIDGMDFAKQLGALG